MAVRTFDPGQVTVSVDGITISGFADGTFIIAERTEESFTKVVGADGQVSRSKSNNRSGTFTITLLQTSPSNETLSALLARDEKNGNAIVPVLIKDNLGTSRLFTGTGWIQKMPNVEYGKEISNREWVIDCAEMDFNIAGNVGVGVASE